MDTQAFLEKVTPSQGNKIIAIAAASGGAQRYKPFKNAADAAQHALEADRAGKTVYYACNGFGDWYIGDDNKKHIRTGQNVVACRSLYDDIDVGKADGYPTQRDAAAALVEFLKQTGLPMPMMVGSGRGLHIYWPLDTDVTPDEWRELARMKRALVERLEFKVDPAADTDIARVLRPVGTTHRKSGDREVKLLRDAGPFSVAQIRAALQDALLQHGVMVAPTKAKVDNSALTGMNYAPSSAYEAVKHCGALKEVASSGGDVSEPYWRAMLGLVKHTIEGDALAHEWSRGHPEYSSHDTQAKLDAWTAGPTTCEEFAKHSAACADCKHRAKKSPIHLGYEAPDPGVTTVQPVPLTTSAAEQPERVFPSNVRISPRGLERAVVLEDDDGNKRTEWVLFCKDFFYPICRIREEDGTWSLLIEYSVGGRYSREFRMPTKVLASASEFAAAMAAHELLLLGKNGRYYAMEFLADVLQVAKQNGEEKVTVPALGWDEAFENFTLGNVRIGGRSDEEVVVSETLENLGLGAPLAATSGTIASWVDIVDQVYNRKGMEPYQLVLCAAFGAPLVRLIQQDSWHGIPIALTGDGSTGKTTVCRVACSIYGPGERFVRTAAKGRGDTLNALEARIGSLRHLPMVFDELTGLTPEEAGGLLYGLSNGRMKQRCRPDGTPLPVRYTWDTLTFINSNGNLMEQLAAQNVQTADAGQVRVFEIRMGREHADLIADIDGKELLENQLSRHYGMVGRAYLKFLIRNSGEITKALLKARARLSPAASIAMHKERFYMDMLACAHQGGTIASKLGFLRFDVNATINWAIKHVEKLRETRANTTASPDELLAALLSSMHGKVIVTRKFGDGRGGTPLEEPLYNLHGAPVARHVIDAKDPMLLVSTAYFSRWCDENYVSPSWLKDELVKLGFIVVRTGQRQPGRKEYLGRGTSVLTGQAQVYEFDYSRVTKSIGKVAIAGPDKVVPITGVNPN